MKTPIDLFVEALSTAAAEALSRKTSARMDCQCGRQADAVSRRHTIVDDSHGRGALKGGGRNSNQRGERSLLGDRVERSGSASQTVPARARRSRASDIGGGLRKSR